MKKTLTTIALATSCALTSNMAQAAGSLSCTSDRIDGIKYTFGATIARMVGAPIASSSMALEAQVGGSGLEVIDNERIVGYWNKPATGIRILIADRKLNFGKYEINVERKDRFPMDGVSEYVGILRVNFGEGEGSSKYAKITCEQS